MRFIIFVLLTIFFALFISIYTFAFTCRKQLENLNRTYERNMKLNAESKQLYEEMVKILESIEFEEVLKK